MQRTSVDLPVPEGPMIAVIPRPSTLSETSLSTGCPERYSLRRWRITSERSTSAAAGLNGAAASMALLLWQSGAQLLLGELGSLALRFPVVGGFVVGHTGLFGDLAHHCPIVPVGDRNEAIAPVEFLDKFWCETEGKKTIADSLD